MSTVRVAINGMGRIGRLFFRACLEREDIEVVAVNDIIDIDYMCYLLQYDTVHGKLPHRVLLDEDHKSFTVKESKIQAYKITDVRKYPWRELKIDYVIECTGKFLTQDSCSCHLLAGAKRVVMSAPPHDKDATKMFVMGVNHTTYSGERIFSNASCTTNCLAPLIKILTDKFDIEEGLMTTIHALTSAQRTVDLSFSNDKDWRSKIRRGRASNNIIPTSTGAASALAYILPDVKDKISGMAFRVPVNDVSVIDLTLRFCESVSKDQVNGVLRDAAVDEKWKGIFSIVDDEVVSTDFIGDSHSCVYDAHSSVFLENSDRIMKLVAFYDNEWGYVNRIADLVSYTSTHPYIEVVEDHPEILKSAEKSQTLWKKKRGEEGKMLFTKSKKHVEMNIDMEYERNKSMMMMVDAKVVKGENKPIQATAYLKFAVYCAVVGYLVKVFFFK